MMAQDAEFEEALDAEVRRVCDGLQVEIPAEMQEALEAKLSAVLRRGADPREVIQRHIAANHMADGSSVELKIPDEARLDQAIWLMKVQLDYALGALKTIAESKLSTEENPIYAGTSRGPGNRIYTPAEVAQKGIEQVESFRLAPKLNGQNPEAE